MNIILADNFKGYLSRRQEIQLCLKYTAGDLLMVEAKHCNMGMNSKLLRWFMGPFTVKHAYVETSYQLEGYKLS